MIALLESSAASERAFSLFPPSLVNASPEPTLVPCT
jgi:hypothetical protein